LIKDKIKKVYRKKKKNKVSQYQDNVKIEIYGSMATGLAIDSSDLDILVRDFIDQNSPRFNGLTRLELIEEMQMIHQELNDIYALKQNLLIDSASVPVIKLQIDLVKICRKEIKD
jgi:predicted nucleotidyltransferase